MLDYINPVERPENLNYQKELISKEFEKMEKMCRDFISYLSLAQAPADNTNFHNADPHQIYQHPGMLNQNKNLGLNIDYPADQNTIKIANEN